MGQAGPQRMGSVAPGDVATKELLQPDGLLPKKLGVCEIHFYVKYTKF